MSRATAAEKEAAKKIVKLLDDKLTASDDDTVAGLTLACDLIEKEYKIEL